MNLNLKPPQVFYGWWIVGACFLIALYVTGVIGYSLTAIFEPIANEFGWSYTQISLAGSLRGLELGLLAPLTGILIDRLGPRRVIFGGGIIATLGLILLSRTTSLGMFYGAFVLIAVGISTSSATVLMAAVVNWFRRRVAIATGIAASGFGFGGLLVPLVAVLIDKFDWRTAMVILGLGTWGIILPLSLLVRHKPEQYGYLPDGEASSTVVVDEDLTSAQAQGTEVNIEAKQALRSRAFWHIALALMCQSMVVSAIITHVMPYLSSIGVARSMSSLVATAIPLTSIGGRLSFGWLADKLDRRLVAAAGFTMVGFGLLCFGYVSTGTIWRLVPFLVLFGIGYGGGNTLRVSLVREYFGRTNFGTIFGLIIGIGGLGSIIGPTAAGWIYDNFGSYQGIWFVFAGLAIVAVISVLTIPVAEEKIRMS